MVSCEWLISLEIHIYFLCSSNTKLRYGETWKIQNFLIHFSLLFSRFWSRKKASEHTILPCTEDVQRARWQSNLWKFEIVYARRSKKNVIWKLNKISSRFFCNFSFLDQDREQRQPTRQQNWVRLVSSIWNFPPPHRYQKQKTQKKNTNCEKFNSTWSKFEQVAISISRAHYIPSHSAAALDDDKFNWIYVGKFSALSAAAKPDATRQATSAISMSF